MKNNSWNSWSNPAARKMAFVAVVGLPVAMIVWALFLGLKSNGIWMLTWSDNHHGLPLR
jgi:hypothetical protein